MNQQKKPPRHIAIIMDGNGRWATKRGEIRSAGHKAGAETVRTITTHCAKIGVEVLTLYAFSTENWKRPKLEVDYLMKLLDNYLEKELKTYTENGIRFRVVGDIEPFSKKLKKRIESTIKATQDNTSLTQVLALNYGSKNEIIRAIKKVEDIKQITEESFEKLLDTAELPPVDMMIRTGGDHRISNFLLWQCAYAEFFFTNTLWPDFATEELDKLLEQFYKRERRFGGI